MGEREGTAAGVIGGARGALPPVGGSKGPEPLASPNVLHWVGWLPGTSRCGAGPAVPASLGAPARRARGLQVSSDLKAIDSPACLPELVPKLPGVANCEYPRKSTNIGSVLVPSIWKP